MATSKGRAEVANFFAKTSVNIENMLRGAARAAATVVADEAKDRLGGRQAKVKGGGKVLIADAVKVRASKADGRIIAKVQVKGPGAYVAPWLEYGTDPHFISVDDSQRHGMSVPRINRKGKEGSLVIGGNFVGSTVFHPGAKAHPFLRVSLDTKEAEAIAAAQNYINSRVTKAGIIAKPEGDDE